MSGNTFRAFSTMPDNSLPTPALSRTGLQWERWVDGQWGAPLDPDGRLHEAVLLSVLMLIGMVL